MKRSSPGRFAEVALGFIAGLAWCLGPASAAATDPALIGASNHGGVLLLHAIGPANLLEGSSGPCTEAELGSWDEARVRVPGNGVPHLVMVMAAFPPESTAVVAATSFGIRYSSNVRVVSHGACNGDGLAVPNGEWPGTGSGIGVVNNPYKRGHLFPVYWFTVSCVGPGTFELTPNPATNMGGRFANDATVPQTRPINGLGRLGFDLEGYLPEPGRDVPMGACCLADCKPLSELECEFYQGLFLGSGTDCSNDPCGPYPLKGACCFPDGRCEMLSLVDCAKAGGWSLGEGVDCGERPCRGDGGAAEDPGETRR